MKIKNKSLWNQKEEIRKPVSDHFTIRDTMFQIQNVCRLLKKARWNQCTTVIVESSRRIVTCAQHASGKPRTLLGVDVSVHRSRLPH